MGCGDAGTALEPQVVALARCCGEGGTGSGASTSEQGGTVERGGTAAVRARRHEVSASGRDAARALRGGDCDGEVSVACLRDGD